MIKYSYRIKSKQMKGNPEDIGREIWDEWSSELFSDRNCLIQMLDEEFKNNQENSNQWRFYAHVCYEIKEVEINNMTIEGIVSDWGEYEDYTVQVGDQKIERLIIDKFKGQKIKINIEVLE